MHTLTEKETTRLRRIEAVATALNDFLRHNVGEMTADWPIWITADEDAAADDLTLLLNELHQSTNEEEHNAIPRKTSRRTKSKP